MPARNARYALTRPLFDLAAEGRFTLPADLLAWRSGIDDLRVRLQDAQNRATLADPGGVQSQLANALPGWAAEGKVPDGWVADLLAAQDEQARAMAEATILDDAVSRAESAMVRLVVDAADEVLTKHLRPVLADVVAKVRKATDGVSVPWDQPSRLARADAKVRAAYAVVEDANVVYEAIRRAQGQLQLLTADAEPDAYGAYNELRNIDEVFPNRAWSRSAVPWPTHPLARLVWVCTPPREPWMPTGSEVMARWLDEQRKKANQPRVSTLPGY